MHDAIPSKQSISSNSNDNNNYNDNNNNNDDNNNNNIINNNNKFWAVYSFASRQYTWDDIWHSTTEMTFEYIDDNYRNRNLKLLS